MDLYSITGNHIKKNNIIQENKFKNAFIEYGKTALAATQSVKVVNPPKKYDYSRWVRKNVDKEHFLLAYPSVSIFPNRNKYTDVATTYVEFNLVVLEKGNITMFLEAVGFDKRSNSCWVSIDIPDSELYYGNNIDSYLNIVNLPFDNYTYSSTFSFNLDIGLHKVRIHIKDDGFHFKSINLNESSFKIATFTSKKDDSITTESNYNPLPEYSNYSRQLMEYEKEMENEENENNMSEDEIINDKLDKINYKLDNLITKNIEDNKVINKSEDSLELDEETDEEIDEEIYEETSSESDIYKVEDINQLFDFRTYRFSDMIFPSNLYLIIGIFIIFILLLLNTEKEDLNLVTIPTPILLD